MPIYEYQCDACGHYMEAVQKMSDAALVECPECGKPSLKKLISAAGFRLSGSGWYETDFKSKDQQKNIHQKEDSKTPKKCDNINNSKGTAAAD